MKKISVIVTVYNNKCKFDCYSSCRTQKSQLPNLYEKNIYPTLDPLQGQWGSEEQISPDFQEATTLTLNADGTLNDPGGEWRYESPWLELAWDTGETDNVMVQRGRDWENKKEALVFTGLNENGTAIWGKK